MQDTSLSVSKHWLPVVWMFEFLCRWVLQLLPKSCQCLTQMYQKYLGPIMGPLTYPRGILHRQTHLMVCNSSISFISKLQSCNLPGNYWRIWAQKCSAFFGLFSFVCLFVCFSILNLNFIPVFVLDTTSVRAVFILKIMKYITRHLNT